MQLAALICVYVYVNKPAQRYPRAPFSIALPKQTICTNLIGAAYVRQRQLTLIWLALAST